MQLSSNKLREEQNYKQFTEKLIWMINRCSTFPKDRKSN